jgi:hypothetical protein
MLSLSLFLYLSLSLSFSLSLSLSLFSLLQRIFSISYLSLSYFPFLSGFAFFSSFFHLLLHFPTVLSLSLPLYILLLL